MTDRTQPDRSAPVRFWPFKPSLTMFLAILVLVFLLMAWGFLRELLHFDNVEAGWVLLGIVCLSLIPIVFLLLEGIGSTGGSIEVGQVVKVALTAAAGAQVLVVAPPNVTPSPVIGDSGSQQIIQGLRRARTAKIVVVSLEDGHAWWESRLLILCAGAARLGQPRVIVFTATREGRVNQFVGWGHPNDIRDRILDAYPDFVTAHDKAMGLAGAARQAHAIGTEGVQNAQLANKRFIIYPAGNDLLNIFLEEQLLADALSHGENHDRREIGLTQLEERFYPVLHKGHVDRTDADAEWFRKALRSDEENLAVTDSGTYIGLMTRGAVITEVLLALTGATNGNREL